MTNGAERRQRNQEGGECHSNESVDQQTRPGRWWWEQKSGQTQGMFEREINRIQRLDVTDEGEGGVNGDSLLYCLRGAIN